MESILQFLTAEGAVSLLLSGYRGRACSGLMEPLASFAASRRQVRADVDILLFAPLRCPGMPSCGVRVGLFWNPAQVPLPDFVQERFAICPDFPLDLRCLAARVGVELPSLWRSINAASGRADVVAALANLENAFVDSVMFPDAQLFWSPRAERFPLGLVGPAADDQGAVDVYISAYQYGRVPFLLIAVLPNVEADSSSSDSLFAGDLLMDHQGGPAGLSPTPAAQEAPDTCSVSSSASPTSFRLAAAVTGPFSVSDDEA